MAYAAQTRRHRHRAPSNGVAPVMLDPRLEALRALEPGWDGFHARVPSQRALNIAQAALAELTTVGPVRVAADVEGGVALYVEGQRPGHFAWLNVDNEDEPALLLSDRASGEHVVHPAPTPEALRALLPEIRSFLAPDR